MGRLQAGQLVEVAGERGRPGGGRTLDERLRHRPQGTERFLCNGLGPYRPAWSGSWPAEVVVEDGGLPGGNEGVVGNDLTVVDHAHPAIDDLDLQAMADQGHGHRVAGRAEPDAGQLVDLAHGAASDLRAQRWQCRKELPLGGEPLGGYGGNLAVDRPVDLAAPGLRISVGSGQVVGAQVSGHHQIPLGIADEVLHDSLRFGVGTLAEVRAEAVVGGEAHIGRRRHHHVGDDGTLQAGHAVRQHHLGHAAEALQALGQEPKRRLGAFVAGEAYEAPAAPGRHGAEDVQPRLCTPVDDQGVARRPHRRPATCMVLGSPRLLRRGNQAPEVAGRSPVARRPGLRQCPLGADASLGRLHPAGDHAGDDVVVVGRLGRFRHGLASGLDLAGPLVDRPLHRPMRGAAHDGGPPVRAYLSVGGN